MNKLNKDLWLFDYSQGEAYEAFSKSQDVHRAIEEYLSNNYDFKDKIVLELGAGSGKFTSYLAGKCSKLYVVEKSESLMRINQRKNPIAKNVEFLLTDARDLELEPNSVDVIFAGWSLTSMRDSFEILLEKFRKVLREDGIILLIENSGNDEFAGIMGIEEFTAKMRDAYLEMGFSPRKTIATTIALSSEEIFYDAFPNKKGVKLAKLNIDHKVLVLEMQAEALTGLVSRQAVGE